ncbi:MAG: hypothetical protein AAGA93_15745 [Actinomycetota bacterium]
MRSTTGRAPRGAGALLLACFLAGLAGCGDDADALTPTTIDVVGVDYAFEGLPDELAAGSEIVFRNESEVEVHEFVALRLDDGDDRSAAELLALPPDQLGPMLGGASSVIIAPPAADGTATDGFVVEGTATLDDPGRYVIFCLIPTGADPEAYLAAAAEAEGGPPDVPGGPPHAVEGMVAELVVRAASG